MTSKVILVTGGGGVGKTTLSAALAVTAARSGVRTLVVTIDPAKRLATALGLKTLGSEPTPHKDEPNLWAAMLDAPASWKAIAHRHAPADVADRLVDNPFFEAATQHFPASQSYASAEEMANYVETRAWDLVVIDTPPAAGGIEFFSAPAGCFAGSPAGPFRDGERSSASLPGPHSASPVRPSDPICSSGLRTS